MTLPRPTFNTKAVLPAGEFFDLIKSRVGRIAYKCAANITKPGTLKRHSNGSVIPHPKMMAIAEPCAKQSRQPTRTLLNAKVSGFHKCVRIDVGAGHVLKVRQNEAEDAARFEITARVGNGSMEVIEREVFQDMRTVDANARSSFQRQTLNNVPVERVGRKDWMAGDEAAKWEPLYSQSWAGVEVEPANTSGQAAAVLGVSGIIHSQPYTKCN
jgi:hypothetical protein